MKKNEILSKLPYSKPFLFVDEIIHIDENGVEGRYTFHENLDFYKGHFSGSPVTPGVILIETMAQIGVVCLGLYLLGEDIVTTPIALSSTAMEFLKPVYPNETVTVKSEKVYFRFGKLKCKVAMYNESGVEVANGVISGMVVL